MILSSTLRDIIHSQKEELFSRDTGIERELLGELHPETGFVTIITGIRRSGKSTLLRQLIRKYAPGHFHFLNFEDPRLTGFDAHDLIKLDKIFAEENDGTLFFFDEIQNVPEWETWIRYKQDKGEKIILTGSNATLLSSELGTRLTGRHLDHELFPFSYREFLMFTREEAGENSFAEYMDRGGFPEYLKYKEPEILYRITEDLLYRDIIARYGVRNHKVLKEMLIYLITNSGKLFSFNNLKKVFSLGSPNTVSDYISFFEGSYLLFTIPRFSYSLKEQMINPRKVYVIDSGLAGVNSISMSGDMGRKLENMVFIRLRKKYKQIYYYRGKGECDFVVREKERITGLYQVCFHLTDDNLDREIKGLLEAMEVLNLTSGTIITMSGKDHFVNGNRQIKVIPAWQWVLEK